MNKKIIRYLLFLVAFYFLSFSKVWAMKPAEFKDRVVCGDQYELAIAERNGSLTHVGCYADYDTAREAMNQNASDDAVILARAYNQVYGEIRTEIADSKYALLDLSVNTQKPYSYFFPDAGDDTGKDNYMDTGALYRSVDGAYLSVNWPNRVAHVKIAGYDGWVNFISSWKDWLTNDYQIVPISWVVSSNFYRVTNNAIHHYLTKNIYEDAATYYINLGPKPDMLPTGDYYSYDGKYFYRDRKTMLQDYKENGHSRAVNSEKPYYNYYMFLPQHSRTTYSSTDIDNYIRNQLGYTATTFDEYEFVQDNRYLSKLYGQGTFLYHAQQYYGVNAIVMLGITRNESGNGRSRISIDKNNGFGDGAVDSSAYQSAKTYASFANTIYAYAHNLFTYGFSNPYDWRYNGSALGNKGVGMNVQYASDPYWSEKAASYYNQFDYARSDYNFYQLGVTTTNNVYAYASASTSSKKVYSYDRADFPMIIVGQEGNFYKVVSDLNIDGNKNQITDGPYNWQNSYVYVPVSSVMKINEGKNGMVSPDAVYHYQDYDYKYEIYSNSSSLYQADTVSQPKVAKLTSNTTFYYDAALTSPMEGKLFTNSSNYRVTSASSGVYVMVYAAAYDTSGNPVSYLVTSDYRYNQQDWVPASKIEFVGLSYGKENVPNGNHWAWVNSTPTDTRETVISGFYNRTYFPIFGETVVNGQKWYQVPADMHGKIGYVLATDVDCNVTYYQGTVVNTPPVITASDKEVVQGKTIDLLEGVSATDKEDGTIVKIEVSGTVDFHTPGQYKITYTVTDSNLKTVSKTITVTVLKDEEPVIMASDVETTLGSERIDLLKNVTATDKEDGVLTVTVDDSKVKYDSVGSFEVIYTTKDSFGHVVTKTVNLNVKENSKPVIYASDKTIVIGSKFDPKSGVSAIDLEDGDLTTSIQVVKNEVVVDTIGSYQVTYQVEDSYHQIVEKTITVQVTNKIEKDGTFYFDYLKQVDGKLELQGYLTISGMNNTLNEEIKYKVIFVNVNGESLTYEQEATRITDLSSINRPIYSPDGFTYTHAWFKADIDINSLPDGNYIMYVQAEGDSTYSKELVNNKLYKTEVTSYQDSEKSVNIKNNYSDRSSAVTLYVRKKTAALKSVDSYYNQYDVWRIFEFQDHKLHLKGASYSYGMNLASNQNVVRKLIFENQSTYETYQYDLGSITNGMYNVALPVSDNLDKTRAWYDATIDIRNLPKGVYTLYMTTTSNITDISEFTDIMGRNLGDKKLTLDGKTYQFNLNLKKGNTIELTVK